MIISFSPEEEQVVDRIMGLLDKERFKVIEHTEDSVVSTSKIKLYSREHRVEIENKNLVLGRKQFSLLLLLVRSPNRIFTKEDIYNYVWNDAVPVNVEETIRYHISDIRKKLHVLTDDSFIETVWGIGYRFHETL